MASLANPFVALSFFGAAVALLIAAVTWRQRHASGARIYALLMVVLAVWTSLYALQLLSPTVEGKRPWLLVRHATIPVITVLFWVFAGKYTDQNEILGPFYMIPVLLAGGALAAIVVFNPATLYFSGFELYTDGQFSRIQLSYGPAFWMMVAYIFLTVGVGHIYIVDMMRKTFDEYQHQLTALAIGGVIEFGLLFLYLTDHIGLIRSLNPWPYVEVVVYGIVLVAIPIGWSYLNQAYFSLQPLALQTVIEKLEDGIFVFDANDRAIYYNEAGSRLLGTTSSSADGIQSAETLFAEQPALRECYYGEKTNNTHPRSERQTEPTDGPIAIETDRGTRYCDIELSAIRNSVNERIGTVLVVRDVTDTHEKQREIRKRTAELERQNERLEMFAGTVSHDLQNPLHTAQGYLELARETNRETHFERVEQSLDRMSSIIDDLLRLARIEMTTEETEPVSVPMLVTDVWETLDGPEATLEVDIPAATTIEADRGLLQNLFENLFRNAIEHNEQPVTVTVDTLDSDGIYIADDGEGPPSESPDIIFEQGYTTDSDSLGFGLSIVKEIANAHGWEIRITESSGGGARFEITGIESMAG